MLFNSYTYFVFLIIVFTLYWLLGSKKTIFQNILLLIASYVFYSWWDPRFLVLIFLSTLVDYFIGLNLSSTKKQNLRKLLVGASIIFNLGLLAVFKYFNFFIESWVSAIEFLGYSVKSRTTLNIILPVGISFYTFQTLSYTLDIYHGRLQPSKKFINFASFVSLFPQLVAGPIERAKNLLPQLNSVRVFDKKMIIQGLYLILWGLFKKVVVADSLAPLTDHIFENYSSFSGGTLLLGLLYFSFQIYCDFSGYSDIAIGTAKLFGFSFMTNFNFPYFAKNITDFWRKWHISLSSWFRDYVYLALGGSKESEFKRIRNIFIVFLLSGLWHGANWTFVFWGLAHSMIYLITLYITKSSLNSKFKNNYISGTFTFIAVTFAWVFFRSPTIFDSFQYLATMFSNFTIPIVPIKGIFYIIILLFFDFCFRKKPQELFYNFSFSQKQMAILFMIIFIWVHFSASPRNFIYFQF